MAYARQYDTRLDIGVEMKPSGEISLIGRIFAGDPETQVIHRIEPYAKITRQQYLARHGGFPSLPEPMVKLLQDLLVHGIGKIAIHEAGHIIVGLHHGSRVLSAHLPVDPVEIAITEFADADAASPEATQDVLAAGAAAESVALGQLSNHASGIDRERLELRFPGHWDAALQRAISILGERRAVFDAMTTALRDAGELKEPALLSVWRSISKV
jgi:hypothetical protein